jgi:hypothetical protein
VQLHYSSFDFAKRWIFVCPFYLIPLSFERSAALAPNGLRIGDGGAFEKRQPNICTNAQ